MVEILTSKEEDLPCVSFSGNIQRYITTRRYIKSNMPGNAKT